MKMNEAALKAEVLKLLRGHEPLLAKALPSAGETPDADTSKKDLASAQSELDRNKRFLEGLYESLVSGDISDAEYKDLKSAYETKIASLTGQIKQLHDTIHSRARQEASLAQAHTNVRKLEQASDLTAEIIDRLVERITVYPGGRLEVKLSFMDATVCNQEGGFVA